MSSYMKDDSSIDIMEFFESDDDSLFHPGGRVRKKPKSCSIKKENRSISPKKNKQSTTTQKKKKPKRKRKPKPADMPRRPLSAYNIYFREQRALIIGTTPPNLEDLGSANNDVASANDGSPPNFQRKKRAHRKTHGKISFSNLAKEIGKSWNDLPQDQRAPYVAGAAKEKERYQKELRIYRLHKKEQEQKKDENKKAEKRSKDQVKEPQPIRSYRAKAKYGEEERQFDMREERRYNHHRTAAFNDQTMGYSRGTYSAIVSPSSNCEDRSGESSYSSHEHDYGYHLNKNRYHSRDHGSPHTGLDGRAVARSQYAFDSINPLPLTYDARHHKEDHIHENDMIKFVSPLLKRKSGRSRRKRLPTTASYYKSEHDDHGRYINKNNEEFKPSCNVSPHSTSSHRYNDHHYPHYLPQHPANANVIGSEPDMPDLFATSHFKEEEGRQGEYRQEHEYSDIASGVFSL